MKQPVQFRSTAAAKATQACPVTPPTVTFANDIQPLFKQFQGPMMWRFDLTSYDTVRDNATLIYGMISTNQMPPPPFSPLTADQINAFQTWMNENFPP
ncbi:MAG TPA: hypothetical protein VE078_11135 [Thermoanaerobaculia bacterium]|nr:hypothetical protein [Thermoanaerobaculia bacterium]